MSGGIIGTKKLSKSKVRKARITLLQDTDCKNIFFILNSDVPDKMAPSSKLSLQYYGVSVIVEIVEIRRPIGGNNLNQCLTRSACTHHEYSPETEKRRHHNHTQFQELTFICRTNTQTRSSFLRIHTRSLLSGTLEHL